MTPPTFQIGDEVLIIGPTITGCKLHTGERFTIEQVDHDKYSGYGLPYYPASSLQLVNKKPLSPMQITYNYKPDDCEHGTIQVSCPCGRKAEIDPNWPKSGDELKIGDWVEVIGPDCALNDCYRGRTFRISQTPCISSDLYSCEFYPNYFPTKSLRKLTPEEIKRHTDKANTFTVKFKCDTSEFDECLDKLADTTWKFQVDERLSAIEKQLKQLHGENGKFLADYREGVIKEDDQDRRLVAIEKRLDFVEKFQRDQAEYRRGMLWVAGP